MASITYSQASANITSDVYDATWASLYSIMDKPQVWRELIQRFGKGIGMLDFLHFTGQTKNVKGNSLTVFEEGAPHKPIKLGAAISTGSAGADISVKLDSTEYDNNNNYYLAVGDNIIIPSAYQPTGVKEPRHYRVMSSTGDAGDLTFTCRPLTKAGTSITASQISTEVPNGTQIAVVGGSYAPGSQGAVAKSKGWYSRTFYTDIRRRQFLVEGSIQSSERYFEQLIGGGKGMYSKASAEADMALTADINDALFLSELNDNTELVLSNSSSVSNAIRATEGIWNHLDARGMEQTYTSSYTMDDFDLLKEYFRSQGVTTGDATFFVGSDLRKYIENSAGLDFLNEYSGGTDLTDGNMKKFREIGIGVGKIFKNGIRTLIFGLDSLDDPNKFGVDSLWFKEAGFVIPQQDVTVSGNGTIDGSYKLRNLCLGYKNYNGENRTRIVQSVSGVNGMGFAATSTYDEVKFELLSEFMLIANKVNQMVKVIPDTVT
jgi:hypothetical protein